MKVKAILGIIASIIAMIALGLNALPLIITFWVVVLAWNIVVTLIAVAVWICFGAIYLLAKALPIFQIPFAAAIVILVVTIILFGKGLLTWIRRHVSR
jgi:hypothetical protein